jgi:hypothetical protein
MEDIGKIEMMDKITKVSITGGKERLVIKGLETKKIKGKAYRAKKT